MYRNLCLFLYRCFHEGLSAKSKHIHAEHFGKDPLFQIFLDRLMMVSDEIKLR